MNNQQLSETIICDDETIVAKDEHDTTAPKAENNNLPEQFKLLKPLGSGGSGSVYLAQDNQLDRQVAVKILKSGLSSTDNQKLLAEARMQAKIEHPNICKIYQVVESQSLDCFDYLVMQYIPGQSALEWLNHTTHIDLMTVVALMQKIADGLQAMHQQGIVHRDIKPANIMLQSNAEQQLQPFLVDFGAANHTTAFDDKVKTTSMGTPAFMSPEQWQGKSLNQSSDVYNFGATLYQLTTTLRPKPIDALTRSNLTIPIGTAYPLI